MCLYARPGVSFLPKSAVDREVSRLYPPCTGLPNAHTGLAYALRTKTKRAGLPSRSAVQVTGSGS